MAYENDDFADAEMPSKESSSEGNEDSAGDSFELLPKSFFQGKELVPGKRCEVEIQHVYDDQVAVSYVPHKGEDKSSSEDEGRAGEDYGEEMSAPRDQMSEMMS